MGAASLQLPARIWMELHDNGHMTPDACDVLVAMEDGTIYTALFVTLPYLRRQMDLSYMVGCQMQEAPAVRFAALETPHLLVDELDRNTIEDTIDNLIALDVFESLFTQVTEDDGEADAQEPRTTPGKGTRTTQEMAAVVLSDVLVVRADD